MYLWVAEGDGGGRRRGKGGGEMRCLSDGSSGKAPVTGKGAPESQRDGEADGTVGEVAASTVAALGAEEYLRPAATKPQNPATSEE